MLNLAGPDSHVHFTHLSSSSCETLNSIFAPTSDPRTRAEGLSHQISVMDLMKASKVPLDRVCLLDPKAENELSPEDGDGRFEWFLFGVSSPYADAMIRSTRLNVQTR